MTGVFRERQEENVQCANDSITGTSLPEVAIFPHTPRGWGLGSDSDVGTEWESLLLPRVIPQSLFFIIYRVYSLKKNKKGLSEISIFWVLEKLWSISLNHRFIKSNHFINHCCLVPCYNHSHLACALLLPHWNQGAYSRGSLPPYITGWQRTTTEGHLRMLTLLIPTDFSAPCGRPQSLGMSLTAGTVIND